MKKSITQSIEVPNGVDAKVESGFLILRKGSTELRRPIAIPGISTKVADGKVTFLADRGNKNELKKIMSLMAHSRNLLAGLNKKFIYKLQSCNVHFPMTLKVEKDKLLINNFLGEKKPRTAVILPGVEVKVSGANITVTGHDKESTGQTAANLEKATKIRNRDRRIFQDGIFITDKALEEAQ